MAEVLVTGGAGFIGRHLVSLLALRGDRVRILDVAAPDSLPTEVQFFAGSVLQRQDVERAMQGVTMVYHLAGIAHLWAHDKTRFDAMNRVGTVTVLEAAAAGRVPRIVHCSTESILLPKRAGDGSMVDESAKLSIDDMAGPYTRSKFRAEEAALKAARDGLDVVVVNPTVPIGAGDRNLTPPAAMLKLFLRGGSPFFLDCVLNLVDVRDVADGIVRAGAAGRSGQRYILGGENFRLGDFLPLLARISDRPMPTRRIPESVALMTAAASEWIADHITGTPPIVTREAVRIALRSAPLDSGKAMAELGYAPRPIAAALAEAVRALQSPETAQTQQPA